ncbi:hypothetical protein CANCADRAFT_132869 [Tortispora caseinolytica NRRL Y-17796]|uniref:Uncharacterized protein n=1 Tax=Tortispora caseinolytica NRRL Y-17796 TaxID=767744 RepID=A0A1E4TB80_9ASCO|nr:hypothetical protein CANCADRAFT_132869 [Tortispora caseinolytica NRRL Y-17796]
MLLLSLFRSNRPAMTLHNSNSYYSIRKCYLHLLGSPLSLLQSGTRSFSYDKVLLIALLALKRVYPFETINFRSNAANERECGSTRMYQVQG